MNRTIVHDDERCNECGACTSLCACGALSLDRDQHLVVDASKCTGCEMCVNACFRRALRLR